MGIQCFKIFSGFRVKHGMTRRRPHPRPLLKGEGTKTRQSRIPPSPLIRLSDNYRLSLRATERSVAIPVFFICCEIASVVPLPRNDIVGQPVKIRGGVPIGHTAKLGRMGLGRYDNLAVLPPSFYAEKKQTFPLLKCPMPIGY